MGPGMSWYLIRFVFEGYTYEWDNNKRCYYNKITEKEYKKPPIGAEWGNASDFVSGWSLSMEDNDD